MVKREGRILSGRKVLERWMERRFGKGGWMEVVVKCWVWRLKMGWKGMKCWIS